MHIGSTRYQLKLVCEESFRPGTSKRAAKVGGVSPYIHSFKTYQKYRTIWEAFLSKAPVRNIPKLTPRYLERYLQGLKDQGQSKRQIQTVAGAVRKLEESWNRIVDKKGWSQEHKIDLRSRVDVNRITGNMEHNRRDRAFRDPLKVVAGLRLPAHQLACQLMVEGGMRIREANHIKPDQLLKLGEIRVKGKGGLVRIVKVSPDLWSKVAATVNSQGVFFFEKKNLGRDLEWAARRSGDPGTPHSFRYNFAQNQYYFVLPQAGYSPDECLRLVSEMLGHHRPDITLRYLAR